MLTFASFTETGGDREANEDAFAVVAHPLDLDCVVCVVADGMGGQPGGGRAAELACRTVVEAVKGLPPARLADMRTWATLFRTADGVVGADPAAGFTTLVGLCVAGDRIVGASHGDSAALLVDLTPVDDPDADVTQVLTDWQRKNPPVGSGVVMPVTFAPQCVGPWKLLVMTDGVWKYVGWRKLIDAAQQLSGAELIADCQRAARLPGSGRFQDDFTLVVIEPDAGT